MRILIVEDEAKLAQFVARGLRAEGHTVETFSRAEDARLAHAEVPFDLIVLDLMLPGMDGIAFCRGLRKGGCVTPILMLTARDAVRDRVQGLDSGADDYLTKPFALDELLARVRALLRRPRESQPARLCVGDLSIDTLSCRVRRGDREIDLSAKEYRLLTYFAANPDRV